MPPPLLELALSPPCRARWMSLPPLHPHGSPHCWQASSLALALAMGAMNACTSHLLQPSAMPVHAAARPVAAVRRDSTGTVPEQLFSSTGAGVPWNDMALMAHPSSAEYMRRPNSWQCTATSLTWVTPGWMGCQCCGAPEKEHAASRVGYMCDVARHDTQRLHYGMVATRPPAVNPTALGARATVEEPMEDYGRGKLVAACYLGVVLQGQRVARAPMSAARACILSPVVLTRPSLRAVVNLSFGSCSYILLQTLIMHSEFLISTISLQQFSSRAPLWGGSPQCAGVWQRWSQLRLRFCSLHIWCPTGHCLNPTSFPCPCLLMLY